VLDDFFLYSYSIKVIDRSKRGTDDYKIHKLRISKKFSSASEIKDQLIKSLKTYVPESDEFDIGYIEPSKQGGGGRCDGSLEMKTLMICMQLMTQPSKLK